MKISDQLAVLNATRYAEWAEPFTPANAKQAVLAFNGDVYDGLDAASLSADDLHFAQARLRILSGLYGVLRPLDLMQPYRLEMGSRLVNERGRDLYAFWGDRITAAVDAAVRAAGERPAQPRLARVLPGAVAVALFGPGRAAGVRGWSGGRFRVVSFFAKRARGLMARFVLVNGLTDVVALSDFDSDGYAYAGQPGPTASCCFAAVVELAARRAA